MYTTLRLDMDLLLGLNRDQTAVLSVSFRHYGPATDEERAAKPLQSKAFLSSNRRSIRSGRGSTRFITSLTLPLHALLIRDTRGAACDQAA
jgi:hypothetical protein